MERIERTVSIFAPVPPVWDAWTIPEALNRWMTYAATLDLRVGGPYRLDYGNGIVSSGTIVALEPYRQLVLADDVGHGEATVTVTLIPADGGTVVQVIDRSAGEGQAWQWFREGVDRWWRDFLRNLKSVLEHGQDLRLTTLWPKATLGVRYISTIPGASGSGRGDGVLVIRITPGSPAEAAGMRVGDVIHRISGRPVATHHDVADVLLEFAPGDRVVVEGLRDGTPFASHVVLAGDGASVGVGPGAKEGIPDGPPSKFF